MYLDALPVVTVWLICPEGAITISGRTASPADLFDLPDKERMAGYDQVLALLQHRRSIREFKDQPIDDVITEEDT